MSPGTDLLDCLRFFSRLPVPDAPAGVVRPLANAADMASIAGAIIGLCPALTIVVATKLGLPPLLGAPLAVAVLVAITGGLHEDGLADCADGFGGGRGRDRKLEIMRDSRIGTFGACALALSLYLRALSIGAIAMASLWRSAAVVVVAASLSRAVCLLPLMLLPPARPDGVAMLAGRPSNAAFAVALATAFGLGLAMLPLGLAVSSLVIAVIAAVAGALGVTALAWRQIEGHTGDVAGTAQQIGEIAVLLVFVSVANGL